MLFTAATLDGLVDGSVSSTYRRWTTVRPKVGSRFTTRAGLVEVTGITVVQPGSLTDEDARAAGFGDRSALLRWIDKKARGPRDTRRAEDGQLYRIDLALAGPDPRVALRAAAPDPEALTELRQRLDRIDAAAEQPWTRSVLQQIAARPGVVSTELADEAGQERFYFKTRVRRLKALGLTESLPVGYRLSPRGEAFLAAEPDHRNR
ncbi:MAG TPA: hypothetical protein VFU98_02615 [Microlunatus sp.]|nr:hypothetical protein [Microlunatus sp.]